MYLFAFLNLQNELTICSDLGKIKYLKDADDFDLDTEQLVSDVFVNEGKADRDGLDQDATIKVVQEQGQAVRQGSVVPDLTPVHYQKPPLPPVPRFSEVPQTLGKRNHDLSNGRNISDYRYGGKKFRQAEIDDTQDEGEPIPSVEQSPELIQDTQASQAHFRRADTKLESPGLPRSFRDNAPANKDELELLPQAPPNFPNDRRNYVLGGGHLTPRTNGLLSNPATRSSAANRQSQLPITPPTDQAVADPTPQRSATNGGTHGSRSPALGAPSTVGKFKPARKNLYEMAESDIEDSQMSPGQDTLPIPRLVKKMSSIENMPSQEQSSYETFNAQAALDPMDLDDNEAFIAEKRHSVSMHNDFGDRARKAAAARRNASSDEIEIPATASDPKQNESTRKVDKASQDHSSDAKSTQTAAVQETEKLTSTAKEDKPQHKPAGSESSKSQAVSGDQSPNAEIKKSTIKKQQQNQKKRAKKLKRQEEQQQQDKNQPLLSKASSPKTKSTRRESTGDSSTNTASTQSSGKRSIFDAGKKPRRSSQLDSPGEQLSQALQESARKPSLLETRSKLADAGRQDESRPSTSGSGSTNANTDTSTSRRSSSGTTGSSPGRLGLGITNSPRKKKDEETGKHEKKSDEPTFSEKLKQAKEDAESSRKDSKTSEDAGPVSKDTAVPSVEKVARHGRLPKACKSLETQCGVLMDKGRQCGRAIDCDVHRVSAKRAVPGRSKPFDILLVEFKTEKDKSKNKEPTPKPPLPNWGSEEPSVAANKTPALAREASSVTSKTSSTTAPVPLGKAKTPSVTLKTVSTAAKALSSNVVPPWMTQEDYERMMKASESTESGDKPKEESAANEMHSSVPAPPVIKVSEEDGSESSSSYESESGSESSGSEDEKKAAPGKESTKQTPASKKSTKDDTKLKTPKPANLQRESTTPGSDFEEITSKLKSIKHTRGGPDTTKLQPPPSRSTLKKKDSVDRRSSAASSETPKLSIKKNTSSVASSSASKPMKPAAATGDKGTLKATPQVATPTPRHETLAAMKARLQAESREASKRSSPAKGMSLGNQGQKKVFDESSESSSSESESSSSDDSDDGKKVKRKKAAKGKGEGSPSAVPDRSIRDPTPDVDSSGED